MSTNTEALFTAALGLQAPWRVQRAELSTAKHRIDFDVVCTERRPPCPHCGEIDQGIHERVSRSWRHLDFFQFEAWLHADIPRVRCSACGKTSQVSVLWAREGSGFTLLFEALALSLCKELPVAQAARHLRADGKALRRRKVRAWRWPEQGLSAGSGGRKGAAWSLSSGWRARYRRTLKR